MSKENKKEKELLNKIEACLFLAARHLNINDIVKFTGVNPLMLRELLDKLTEQYNSSDRGLVILKRDAERGEEMWKMDVKTEFSFLVNKLATGESEFTRAEQETLAVIAYKQPIKQSIIVKIRGNKAYDHIKRFIVNSLISARKSGRTLELTTTNKFYDYFNIKNKK